MRFNRSGKIKCAIINIIHFGRTRDFSRGHATRRGIFRAGKSAEYGVSACHTTSYPLKYPLGTARKLRRGKPRRKQGLTLPLCSARCGGSSSSSWNVKLWWTAIVLSIRLTLTEIEYTSRDILPPLSPSPVLATTAQRPSPSRHPWDIFRYRDSDLMRFYESTMWYRAI